LELLEEPFINNLLKGSRQCRQRVWVEMKRSQGAFGAARKRRWVHTADNSVRYAGGQKTDDNLRPTRSAAAMHASDRYPSSIRAEEHIVRCATTHRQCRTRSCGHVPDFTPRFITGIFSKNFSMLLIFFTPPQK
jgi:hypothetical protein